MPVTHDYSLAAAAATEFSFGGNGTILKFDSDFSGHPCQAAMFACDALGVPYTVLITDGNGVEHSYTVTGNNSPQDWNAIGPSVSGKVRSMQISHASEDSKELFKAVLECFSGDCTFAELLEYCGAILGPLTKEQITELFVLEGDNAFKELLSCFDVSLEEFVACLPEQEMPAPSEAIPIPDNEVDTAIRTGFAGTSVDYARADHNHPIRRQANPGNPVLTALGNSTAFEQGPVRFRSDEESVYFEMRPRLDKPAGNGWTRIVVPNIAGFQLPMCYKQGTYRNVGNPQPDNSTSGTGITGGALPEQPFMGGEGTFWSLTRQMYFGFRAEEDARYYPNFIAHYIRS